MPIDDHLSSRKRRFFRRRKPDVSKLRRRGDIAGLCAAVEYREAGRDATGRPVDLGAATRVEAVLALSDFYGPLVTRTLFRALADPSAHVRVGAARGLRLSRSPAAVEPLLHALALWPDEGGERARGEALAALAELPGEELPERFAAKLVDARSIAPTVHHEAALTRLLALDPRGAAAARAVAEWLISALEGGDDERRERAETVIGWVSPSAVELLAEHVEGPARAAIARLLGMTGHTRAVDPLIELLADRDPDVRLAAVKALGQLKHTRAVEPLLYASRDPDFSVREAADAALDAMGVAAVVVGLAALVRPMLPGSHEAGADAENGDHALPWAQRVIGRLIEGAPERD